MNEELLAASALLVLSLILFEDTLTSFLKEKKKKEVTKQEVFLTIFLDDRRIRIQEAQKHNGSGTLVVSDTRVHLKFAYGCQNLSNDEFSEH